jgi:hypothetical protein
VLCLDFILKAAGASVAAPAWTGVTTLWSRKKKSDEFCPPRPNPSMVYARPHLRRWRENRVEVMSDSWVSLNRWSMAADSPLAAGASVEEIRDDPLMDTDPLEDACEWI